MATNSRDFKVKNGLYVSGNVTITGTTNLTGALSGSTGSFTGNVVAGQTPNTSNMIAVTGGSGGTIAEVMPDGGVYGYGMRIPATGGWHRTFSFWNNDRSARLGAFGANGSDNALSYLYVGQTYSDAYATKFYPATGNIDVQGVLNSTLTTDSTSSTTGAVKIAGGLGVAKKLYVGSSIYASGSVIAGSSAQITLGASGASTVSIESNAGDGTVNLFTVNRWTTLAFGASGNNNTNFDVWCNNINLKGKVLPNSLDTSQISSTTNAASYYYVSESDQLLKPKTLSNVKTEIVTTAAVNSAAATTVGTVTTGAWNTGTIANQTSTFTLNIGGGAATTGQSKNILIGQNGLSGSSVYVTIGTTASGVTSDVGIYGANVTFKPSGYLGASLNLPHGTATGFPVNGDMWTTTSGLFAYINGATQQYAPLAGPTFTGTVTTPGVKRTLVTKTALYTLTATDHIVVATSGTWNATLPTAASVAGREYIVKNSGTGVITVDTTSSQTIDGSASIALSQYDSLTVVSDGSNWVIL